jgi:hypothetical protein
LKSESETKAAFPPALHARSAVELKRIFEAERAGQPFLLWRDARSVQRIFRLEGAHAVVGRGPSSDVVLEQDAEVSRVHAELERLGDDWTVTDDGLSRNGTFVNGSRVRQRRRLADGDVLRCGRTLVEFRSPTMGSIAATAAVSDVPTVESLTAARREILVALCRPYLAGADYASPASNQRIANEVFLGVDAIKHHLRVLFQRFDIAELPQNQKRARLVECAFQCGLVSERDL